MSTMDILSACDLCPHECGVNRTAGGRGRCGADGTMRVARAALHFWEEPCISGTKGSGTIFFTGCSLRCRFCQNTEISRNAFCPGSTPVNPEQLAHLCLSLEQQGANNINLVTAAHYLPLAAQGIKCAKEQGLGIPIVYNSSGYEKAGYLKMLEGLVDIYLPDFKYMNEETALACSGIRNYPETAKEAVSEMVRQCPKPSFTAEGMMQKGVIVRHLLLPGHVHEAKEIVKYLYETYGNAIYISLLSQYTPMRAVQDDPLLSRRVTKREYERLVDYALSLGVEQGFIQDREVAKESFIPAFNGEGVSF